MKKQEILKGAIIGGCINALINGTINWFSTKEAATIFLTTDSITKSENTVFGEAVVLGSSLAFILTSIAFFTTKIENKPSYFPSVFKLALEQTIFAFGTLTIFGLLFQRYFGAIEVTTLNGAIITGIIAGIASTIVEYTTKKRLLGYL